MWLHGALYQHCSEHPPAAAYRTLHQHSPHPSRRRAERYWCAFQTSGWNQGGVGAEAGLAGFDRRPKSERDFPHFIAELQWEKWENTSTLATRTADLFCLPMAGVLGIWRLGGVQLVLDPVGPGANFSRDIHYSDVYALKITTLSTNTATGFS